MEGCTLPSEELSTLLLSLLIITKVKNSTESLKPVYGIFVLKSVNKRNVLQ